MRRVITFLIARSNYDWQSSSLKPRHAIKNMWSNGAHMAGLLVFNVYDYESRAF